MHPVIGPRPSALPRRVRALPPGVAALLVLALLGTVSAPAASAASAPAAPAVTSAAADTSVAAAQAPVEPPPAEPVVEGVLGYEGVRYAPVTPVRIMTPRAVTAGSLMTFRLPNVPAGATAVALNLTVVAPSASSYVSACPGGSTLATCSALTSLNTTATQNIANRVVVRLGGPDRDQVSFYLRRGTATLLADLHGWHVDVLRGQVAVDGRSVGVRHGGTTTVALDLGTLQAGKTYDVHISTRTGSGALGRPLVRSSAPGSWSHSLVPEGGSFTAASTGRHDITITGTGSAPVDYVITVSSRLVVPVPADSAPVSVRATRPGQGADLVLGTYVSGRFLDLVTASQTAGTGSTYVTASNTYVATVARSQAGLSRHRMTTGTGAHVWHVVPPLGATTAYQALTPLVVPTAFTGEQAAVDLVENQVLWVPVGAPDGRRLNLHVAPENDGAIGSRFVSAAGVPLHPSAPRVDTVTDGGRGMAMNAADAGTHLEVTVPAGRSVVTTSRPLVVPVLLDSAEVTSAAPLPGQEVQVEVGGRVEGDMVTVNVGTPDGWTGTTSGQMSAPPWGNHLAPVVREVTSPTFLLDDGITTLRLAPGTPWPAGVRLLASTAVDLGPLAAGGDVSSGQLRTGQAVRVTLSLPFLGTYPYTIQQPSGSSSTVVQRERDGAYRDAVTGSPWQGYAWYRGNPVTLLVHPDGPGTGPYTLSLAEGPIG